MISPDEIDRLEALCRKAEGRLASEQQRFSQTLSARYSPMRLMDLAAEAAKARRNFLEAKYGRREQSRKSDPIPDHRKG